MPAFLTSRLAGPIAAALLLLSVLGNAFLGLNLWAEKRANGKLTDRIVTLAQDLQTSRSNEATTEAALRGQNAAIDQLKSAAEIAAAKAAKAQAEAEREADVYRRRAADLAKAKPASSDLCAAAVKLIDDTLAGERK
jgi:hypothetical protein